MTRFPSFLLVLAAAAAGALAPAAHAQGNLSTQGFGYPTGQLSTRALGAGGATAETDPASPVNPASIVNWGASAVFFQADPEFRTVTSGGGVQRTTTARYPLTTASLTVSPRARIGVSVSTLLDRTWTTTEEGSIDLGGTPVATTTSYVSEGAINDIRLAGGYAARDWLRVGLGAHAFTGRNLLLVATTFSDSTAFIPLSRRSVISYGGTGLSGGVEVRPAGNFSVAASVRVGGSITAERNDSTISRANVPTRFGIGIGYLGVRGATIGVRAAHDGWSSLGSLGESGLSPRDAWDLGAGADMRGPRFGRNTLQLRAGVRRRTLPFEAAGEPVRESSFTFGTGTAFANGRVFGDVALARAMRSIPSGGAEERAWTLSMGLAVRP